MQKAQKPRKKRFWPKILLSVVSLILVLGATEIGLRLAGYASGPARYFDPEIGYRFYPNQTRSMMAKDGSSLAEVRLNREGFRGPCYPIRKNPNTLRIACIGDSFTFGWAVTDDQTYPFHLRHRLERLRGSDRVEVMNFGIPGYNTENALRQYQKLVRPWKPDIVILGYVFNDPQPEGMGPRHMNSFLFQVLGCTALLEAFHRHLRNRFSFLKPEYPPGMEARRVFGFFRMG